MSNAMTEGLLSGRVQAGQTGSAATDFGHISLVLACRRLHVIDSVWRVAASGDWVLLWQLVQGSLELRR